jgi:hypothetical protein
MTFERYKLFESRSLAHRLFKRHHTHFNDIYWSQRIAHNHIFAQTKPFSRSDPVNSLFTPMTTELRNNRTLGQWGDWYSDFDTWTRMGYIIALAGYLETYIAQISVAAFESTPSLIFGGGPKIDGAIYLKYNHKYDLYDYSESLTRGSWQSRISAYKNYFGSCPFEQHISDLELLRRLRNDAGHSFGRDIKSMKFAQAWEVKKLKKIPDEKIMHFLMLVEDIANSIDEQIAETYVGQYEIIKVYHNWFSTLKNKSHLNQKEIAKLFRTHFHQLTSAVYLPAKKLIPYYESL